MQNSRSRFDLEALGEAYKFMNFYASNLPQGKEAWLTLAERASAIAAKSDNTFRRDIMLACVHEIERVCNEN